MPKFGNITLIWRWRDVSDQNSQSPINLKDLDNAPEKLPGNPSLIDAAGKFETLLTRFSDLSGQLVASKEEVHRLKSLNSTRALLDDLIKPYAGRAYWYMCVYSFVVGIFLLLTGCQTSDFHLPDSVLNFLVGSTAVTVIGLVGMVLTGIFVGARK